jgi:hypothetical protein
MPIEIHPLMKDANDVDVGLNKPLEDDART